MNTTNEWGYEWQYNEETGDAGWVYVGTTDRASKDREIANLKEKIKSLEDKLGKSH